MCASAGPEREVMPVTRRTALGLAGLGPLLPYLPVPEARASTPLGPREVISDLAATVLGEPVTDPRIILRNALPKSLHENPIVAVEDLILGLGSKNNLRSAAGSRSIAQSEVTYENVNTLDLGALESGVRKAQSAVRRDYDAILAAFPADNRQPAAKLLVEMEYALSGWNAQLDSGVKYDQGTVTDLKNDLLNITSQMQGLLVSKDSIAAMVPPEYSSLPQLRGRAVVELKVRDVSMGGEMLPMTLVLDGLNAPVTAGNFAKLVQSKFYDGMTIQRADGFVVQTGESAKPTSTIPLEVRYQGEVTPEYGMSKEELGLMRKQVVLPFNALGTLAMARQEFESNSGNSQIFFLQKESEVTPAGANMLDGNYAVFGYVVEGAEHINRLAVDDVIQSARVVYGADNLTA